MSKNFLAPIKKMSIDRIELCGVVLNKPLKQLLEKEVRDLKKQEQSTAKRSRFPQLPQSSMVAKQ